MSDLLRNSGIPARFEDVELGSYITDAILHKSQKAALLRAITYVEELRYLDGKGLSFTGTIGTGKTHLAVGVLKAAIEKGHTGFFCNEAQFLVRSRTSNLDPLLTAKVLVLDGLGNNQSEEMYVTILTVLDERYSDKLATIVTTNYAVEMPKNAAGKKWVPDTLGDRIGARSISRLLEVNKTIEVVGMDFRDIMRQKDGGMNG